MSGYTLFGARWYSPEIGRGISEDPIIHSNPIQYRTNINLYSYSFNNPSMYTDLIGLNPEEGPIVPKKNPNIATNIEEYSPQNLLPHGYEIIYSKIEFGIYRMVNLSTGHYVLYIRSERIIESERKYGLLVHEELSTNKLAIICNYQDGTIEQEFFVDKEVQTFRRNPEGGWFFYKSFGPLGSQKTRITELPPSIPK